MKRIVAVVVLSLAATACSTGQVIGHMVGKYCAVPAENRHIIRQTVALATEPNKITIKCAADG